MAAPLQGFATSTFTSGGCSKPVHRLGSGPPVLVMHEVPGITPQVERFARLVAAEGFTVVVPQLFGEPGVRYTAGALTASALRACVSREFHLFAARDASPLTGWLRALCRTLHEELGGKGVGAIGMCITGNFALTLMVDPWVMAAVLGQPSLPVPVLKSLRSELHVSDADLEVVKGRVARGEKVLGLRFSDDWLCPAERFARLQQELGEGFEGIVIDSSPGNAHGFGRTAHSAVTRELVDEEGHPTKKALQRVLGFFDERLK